MQYTFVGRFELSDFGKLLNEALEVKGVGLQLVLPVGDQPYVQNVADGIQEQRQVDFDQLSIL